MGDLNADCNYYNENADIPLENSEIYKWLITDSMDTNVAGKSCTYDRILVTGGMYEFFTGDAGVLRFDEVFELDCETKAISDHYPVYSVFRIPG